MKTKPPTTVCDQKIPKALKALSRWVVWRRETRNEKLTKVPYNAKTERRASVTDPSTWTTFNNAMAARDRDHYDGIGFVLTADDDITGVDLDHCRDPITGIIEPWALAIIDQLYSYTEISPSGTGIRIFVHGRLPPIGRKKGPLEFYETERYLTVTGNHLADTPLTIEDRHQTLQRVHAVHFPPPRSNGNGDGHQKAKPITADDETQLSRMFASRNGEEIKRLYEGDWRGSRYPSQSEADSALCFHLAWWFGKDTARMDRLFRQSGLMRAKWDERHGALTYGERTIANACENVTHTYADDAKDEGALVMMTLANVEAEQVRWLWVNRIALGKVNLLIGQPGVGKSYLSLYMAAQHSRGTRWSDEGLCPKGPTILLGAEDGLADTIRPRLDALGADVTQVHAITAVRDGAGTERGFDLSRDVRRLRLAVQQTKATLVVIDPLTAYLGKTESYKDAEVRAVLAPLARLAEEEGVAVVCVMHLNKSTTATVLNRASGSVAFGAAARTVFGVGLDPDDPTRHLFIPIKMNVAALPPALAFRIVPGGLTWETGPVTGVSQERVFGAPARGETESQQEARAFLRDLLKDGTPVPAEDIYANGKKEGFSPKQLRRAAKAERVKFDKEGFQGKSTWMMPF